MQETIQQLKTQLTIKQKLKSYWRLVQILSEYSIADIRRKSQSFKVGVFIIFFVVSFISVLNNSLELSSLIFLRNSEQIGGDNDLLVSPSIGSSPSQTQFSIQAIQNLLLNNSRFDRICNQGEDDLIFGSTPRWVFQVKSKHPKYQNLPLNANKYFLKEISAILMVSNTSNEISIGMGRRLKTQKLRPKEALISSTISNALRLDEGQFKKQLQVNIQAISQLIRLGVIQNDTISQLLSQTLGGLTNATNTAAAGQGIIQQTSLQQTQFQEQQLRQLQEEFQPQYQNTTKLNGDELFRIGLNIPNQSFNDSINQLNNILTDFAQNITLNVDIKQEVIDQKGKWVEDLGNVVVLDQKSLAFMIVDQIYYDAEKFLLQYSNSQINRNNTLLFLKLLLTSQPANQIYNSSKTLDLNDFTITENILMKDKVNSYTDTDNINNKLVRVSDRLFDQLGSNFSGNVTTPAAVIFKTQVVLKYFLDNIFTSAVFILIMLSILLIYSLMIQNVDEKTYEFGMLRALGLKLSHLFYIIAFQSVIYSSLGLASGLIFCFIINSIISNYIYEFTQLVSSYQIVMSSIVLAFLIGLVMPVVSNILPIKRALSRTLKDSLDLYHRVNDQLSVSVQKLENMGLSPGQSLISLTLIVIGIITYYFAPMAFLNNDIQLFLIILNTILILMILGFTLLINLIQTWVEKVYLYSIIYIMDRLNIFKDIPLIFIIRKNMEAHYKRNYKTALMVTVAISFVIFNGASFGLQLIVILQSLKLTYASDINIQSFSAKGIPEQALTKFIKEYRQQYPNDIKSFSFTSTRLNQIPGLQSKSIKLSSVGGFPSYKISLYGVDDNYLQSVYNDLYLPNEYESDYQYRKLSNGKSDGFQSLDKVEILKQNQVDQYNIISNSIDLEQKKDLDYLKKNEAPTSQINVIVPEGIRIAMSSSVGQIVKFNIDGIVFKGKISHMATKVPGTFFTSYQTSIFFLSGYVSTQQLDYIRKYHYNSQNQATREKIDRDLKDPNKYYQGNSYDIPKSMMLIKFQRKLSYDERMNLINGIRTQIDDDQVKIIDFNQIEFNVVKSFDLLDIINLTITLMSIIITFFLLLVSQTQNIKENQWEFGVLRSLGLNINQMTRIYMYETLVIVVSSVTLGSLIGIITAISIAVQFNIFNEFPFQFVFPTLTFVVTLGMAIFTAVVSSYYALKEIKYKSISNIVKGLEG